MSKPETIVVPRTVWLAVFSCGAFRACRSEQGAYDAAAQKATCCAQGGHRARVVAYRRAVPLEAIIRQVRRLVEGGYKEVVLTGVDICSYGKDTPGGPGLGRLARKILAEAPDLQRLRLSTLDPAAIDDDLYREAFVEHDGAKMLIAELMDGAPDDAFSILAPSCST